MYLKLMYTGRDKNFKLAISTGLYSFSILFHADCELEPSKIAKKNRDIAEKTGVNKIPKKIN